MSRLTMSVAPLHIFKTSVQLLNKIMSKRPLPHDPTYKNFVDSFLTVVRNSLEGDNIQRRVANSIPLPGKKADVSIVNQRFALGADDSMYLNAGVAMLAVASAEHESPLTSPASYSAETLNSTKEALLKLAAVDRTAERARAPARLRAAAKAFRIVVDNYAPLSDELQRVGVLQTLKSIEEMTKTPEKIQENLEKLKKLFNTLDELLDPRNSVAKVVESMEAAMRTSERKAVEKATREKDSQILRLREELQSVLEELREEERRSTELSERMALELQANYRDLRELEPALEQLRAEYAQNLQNASENSERLGNELRRKEAQLETLRRELEENEALHSKLGLDYEDQKARNATVMLKLNAEERTKKKLQKRNEELNGKLEELKAERIVLEQTKQANYEYLQRAFDENQKQCAAIQEEFEKLKDENEQFREALQFMNEELEGEKRENVFLEKEILEITAENDQLKSELDATKRASDVVGLDIKPASTPPPPPSPPPSLVPPIPVQTAASLQTHLLRVVRASESLGARVPASKRIRSGDETCPFVLEESLDALRFFKRGKSVHEAIGSCDATTDAKDLLKQGLASAILRNPAVPTAVYGAGVGIDDDDQSQPASPGGSPARSNASVQAERVQPAYYQLQNAFAAFIQSALNQLALFEDVKDVESSLNKLFPSGTATERRGVVWNEMLRDASLAGDRLWSFIRVLSGLIGESADAIFSSMDDAAIKAQAESQQRRNDIAKQVSEFQGKLLSELAGSLLKNSTLQFATSSNDGDEGGALVVVDAEAAKKIKDMAAGTSGMPFFEANVALRNLENSASGKPQSIDKIVADIAGLGRALYDRLMEQLIPTLNESVSLTDLAHPRNSYCVRLKDDTTAAILEAFDRFSTELALRGGGRVKLWELIEGADATLSQRFAAFVGHVLVQNRTSTGVNALYTSRAQLSVNSTQAGVSLQRLINQAIAYRSRVSIPNWKDSNIASARNRYFNNAKDVASGSWAHSSFRGSGPVGQLYRVGWVSGISY